MLNDLRDTFGYRIPELFPAGTTPQGNAVIAAMPTTPNAARQKLIQTLVKGLLDDGIWAMLDILYLTAADASLNSLINWINPGTHDLTVVNLVAGQFTIDRGWTGNGVNGYLDTNYNPSTDGINFTLNDASIGAYCRLNIQEDTVIIGCQAGGPGAYIYPRDSTYVGNSILSKLNDSSLGSVPNLDSKGFYIISRDVAAHKDIYKNTIKTEHIEVSTTIPNQNIYILGLNNGGALQEISTNQIAEAHAGGGMTQTNVNNFTDRLETFMDAIGAGVI